MSSFEPVERRLAVTCERYPAFPREPAVLVRLIKHLYKRIHTNANSLLKPFGISHPEYDVLMMMYGTPDQSLSPTQVAEAAGEKSANVTRLTDQLCEKGLISRGSNEEDRRKVTLTLEPAGVALIERMLPQICGLLEAEVSGLGDDEQLRLETLLKKMLDGLESL